MSDRTPTQTTQMVLAPTTPDDSLDDDLDEAPCPNCSELIPEFYSVSKLCTYCNDQVCPGCWETPHQACDYCVKFTHCECHLCCPVVEKPSAPPKPAGWEEGCHCDDCDAYSNWYAAHGTDETTSNVTMCACCGNDSHLTNWCTKCEDEPNDYNTQGSICYDCYHKDDLCITHYADYLAETVGPLPWKIEDIARFSDQWREENTDHLDPEDLGLKGYWQVCEAWGMEIPSPQVPTEGFADFYLTEIVAHQLLNPHSSDPLTTELVEAGRRLQAVNVMFWDHQMLRYMDMIVGGELRHSPQMGTWIKQAGSGSRANCWLVWLEIRRTTGPDILLRAADWFEAYTDSGYGGLAWATIARTVHARITNQISPAVFVDRCWSLMHNGGPAINKINWFSDDGGVDHSANLIFAVLGPAQAATDTHYDTLMLFASPPVRSLFQDYVRQANLTRRVHGVPLLTVGYPSIDTERMYHATYHQDAAWHVAATRSRKTSIYQGASSD